MTNYIPKEYMLESPSNYDIVRTENLIRTFLSMKSGKTFFSTIFDNPEDRAVSVMIYDYLFDCNPHIKEEEFIHLYILSLSESGFFG